MVLASGLAVLARLTTCPAVLTCRAGGHRDCWVSAVMAQERGPRGHPRGVCGMLRDEETGNRNTGAGFRKDGARPEAYVLVQDGWTEGHQALASSCSQQVTRFQHGGGVLFLPPPSSSVKPATRPTIQLDSDTSTQRQCQMPQLKSLWAPSPTLPPPNSGAHHRAWLSPVLLTDQQWIEGPHLFFMFLNF